MFKVHYDKFQRWLKRFKPDYFQYYKKGYDQGDIDIEEISWGYHLYFEGELLGTLIEK